MAYLTTTSAVVVHRDGVALGIPVGYSFNFTADEASFFSALGRAVPSTPTDPVYDMPSSSTVVDLPTGCTINGGVYTGIPLDPIPAGLGLYNGFVVTDGTVKYAGTVSNGGVLCIVT